VNISTYTHKKKDLSFQSVMYNPNLTLIVNKDT